MQLPAISTEKNLFSLLAIDEVRVLSDLLNLDLSLADNNEFLMQILSLLMELLPEASGLVMDPIYGLPLLSKKSAKAGVLLRLSQDQSVEADNLPQLFPNFSLQEVKNNYALAKLELFYDLHSDNALEKKQLLAEIKDYCQTLGIDFLLKLKLPDAENDDSLLATLQELRNLADIFVLSEINNPLSAATITSELDVPWLLTTTDDKQAYDDFKDQLRTAVENGARGYYLGNFLWQDLVECRLKEQSFDWPAMEKLVRGKLRDHLIELNRIIAETAL